MAAVIVVVVVVAVGSGRSGSPHSGSTVAPTRAIIAATITWRARYRTARAASNRTPRRTGTACDRVRRPASGNAMAVTTVDASGMNSATPYMAGTHASAMKSSTAAKTATPTPTTPRECIIWN